MKPLIDKRVHLNIDELDGNAFAIMAGFRRQAFREGWSIYEVTLVIGEAKRKDYEHLKAVIKAHCIERNGDD